MRVCARWTLVAFAAVMFAARPALAQGVVSGRVAMQEKPGESTKDFDGTVIYLVRPRAPACTIFTESKAQMAMKRPAVCAARARGRPPDRLSRIRQSGPVSATQHFFGPRRVAAFDLGTYGGGIAKSTSFKKPGAFPVYCNIHAQMTAFVVVVSTPYFTQAGADARWKISGVPAGKYTLHVWHERATEVTQEIDVPAAGLANADVTLDARGFKQVAHKDKLGKDY